MKADDGSSLKVDLSIIRYAQCWEDADVLVEALDLGPGRRCLSIASAGDNALALLARGPEKVVAIDLSPAQIACVELRVAAYRRLEHGELLELLGVRPSDRRAALYERCRSEMGEASRRFWDGRPHDVAAGIGQVGRFEHYLATFRRRLLPLVHGQGRIRELLERRPEPERVAFYDRHWDTWRWRLLCRAFFSRFAIGRLGRDPSFFDHVEGTVADRFLARSRYALTALDPAANPYLQWILVGEARRVLPLALRPESFEAIRANLEALELRCESVESYLARCGEPGFDAYNLSDMFEYMPEEAYHHTLQHLVRAARPGARLAYWNLLVPRHRPEAMAGQLRPLAELSSRLHARDMAFFYSDFVLEEVL